MTQLLAQQLWHARQTGTVIDTPTEPFTLQQAYAIQDEVVALSRLKKIGWKVGSTSAEAQAKLGTDQPGASALLDGLCYGDADEIPIHPAHHVFVEAEFAFRLGVDIDTDDVPNHQTLHSMIDGFLPAIEVVGSRYKTGLDGTGVACVTADGGANIAFIYGTLNSDWNASALPEQPVELTLNDSVVAIGTGARALGHPLNVLQWLIGHCHERTRPLRAGDIVTTGTCTGLVAIAPGDHVTADFPGLGSVSARFIQA